MWSKKKINFIKQKNLLTTSYNVKTLTTITKLKQRSDFIRTSNFDKEFNTNVLKTKSLCTGLGKYNNNFSTFKCSRHFLKFLITKNYIFLPKKKW